MKKVDVKMMSDKRRAWNKHLFHWLYLFSTYDGITSLLNEILLKIFRISLDDTGINGTDICEIRYSCYESMFLDLNRYLCMDTLNLWVVYKMYWVLKYYFKDVTFKNLFF